MTYQFYTCPLSIGLHFGHACFFGKLLHCTSLSPVQCNNFPKTIDTVVGLQAFVPITYSLLFEFLKKEQSTEDVQGPQRHALARTDVRLPRPGFARIRWSQHMGAAVCGRTLYIATRRFVWNKKCRMRSCKDLSSSQHISRSQPMERYNGVDELIVFHLQILSQTMTARTSRVIA